jgi:hypothetical protein
VRQELPATMAGESRCLRAIIHTVLKEMTKQIVWPMNTINISLPEALKSFANEQVNQGSFSISGEYFRELLRTP